MRENTLASSYLLSLLFLLAHLESSQAYDCNVAAYPGYSPVPFAPSSSVSDALTATTLFATGSGLTDTVYSYDSYINGKDGVYNTDCSCFVNYLLSQVSVAHFKQIPVDHTISPPLPRAFNYRQYFASLLPSSVGKKGGSQLWEAVTSVLDVSAGDVIAWSLPPSSGDTGHVMVALNAPGKDSPLAPCASAIQSDSNSSCTLLYVADASRILHTDDTRCLHPGPNTCRFATGVGRGFVVINYTGENGVPVGFSIGQGHKYDPVGNGYAISFGRPKGSSQLIDELKTGCHFQK